MECLAMLSEGTDENDFGNWLLIHENRDAFIDSLKAKYIQIEGLSSELIQLKAHPNFTEDSNHYFV